MIQFKYFNILTNKIMEKLEKDPQAERAERLKSQFDQLKAELMQHSGGGAAERDAAQKLLNAMNYYLMQIPHGSSWKYDEIDLKLEK